MKEAPITLQNYFASDLLLATNHSFAPDKPLEFKDADFIADVSVRKVGAADPVARNWQVALEVRHQPSPETNFPYSYRVVLVGLFGVSPRVKQEDEERMVRIQGASVLYGMTREIVRVLTGRGPYRPVLIPTVSFYEQKEGAPASKAPAESATSATQTQTPPAKPKRSPKAKK